MVLSPESAGASSPEAGVPNAGDARGVSATSPLAKLAWYVNRARSMPPGEFVHRGRQAVLKRRYRSGLPELQRMVSTGPRPVLLPVVQAWSEQPTAAAAWSLAVRGLLTQDLSVFGRRWPFRDGSP